MTAPLDEARLRELAEALTFFGRYADETRDATTTRRNNNANDASKAILALLDALSAERERADRAAGHLRAMSHVAPRSHEVEAAYAFLATQKAEG